MFRLLRLLFLLLVPLAILGAALSEVDEEWENFKTVYDKQYGLDEADRWVEHGINLAEEERGREGEGKGRTEQLLCNHNNINYTLSGNRCR